MCMSLLKSLIDTVGPKPESMPSVLAAFCDVLVDDLGRANNTLRFREFGDN